LLDVERAAALAGAPFFMKDVALSAARSQWSYAFEVMNRVTALEEAIADAKQCLGSGGGSKTFMDLKREHDRLRRAISSRQIWGPEQPS